MQLEYLEKKGLEPEKVNQYKNALNKYKNYKKHNQIQSLYNSRELSSYYRLINLISRVLMNSDYRGIIGVLDEGGSDEAIYNKLRKLIGGNVRHKYISQMKFIYNKIKNRSVKNYLDIGCGSGKKTAELGKMFGFHFLENFNYPYISRSIREFWKRWHISLSNWFKDYLYIPLGGNRCKPSRVYFNLILVFFLCGLWHGATWNFVIWGLFHGVFLAIERTRFGRFLDNINIIFQHLYTMLVVIIGWVLFRADNLSQAIIFLKAMIGLGTGTGITYYASFYINIEVIITLIIGLIGFTPIVPFISRYLSTSSINKKVNIKSKSKRKIISSIIAIISIIILIAILIYSAMQLASGTYNPFIYFRF